MLEHTRSLKTFGMSQLRFNHTPDPQNLFLLTNKLWNLVPKVSDPSFLSCIQKYFPAYNIPLNQLTVRALVMHSFIT